MTWLLPVGDMVHLEMCYQGFEEKHHVLSIQVRSHDTMTTGINITPKHKPDKWSSRKAGKIYV